MNLSSIGTGRSVRRVGLHREEGRPVFQHPIMQVVDYPKIDSAQGFL
jgi:hypothetical protein